jgi:BirA family biotin operon repressor/biotin-[acetyl-CoA-carboxylase] ligase
MTKHKNADLTQETIKDVYKGSIIGSEIIYFDSIASTNAAALETGGQREKPEGIVVVADSQTQGKGRLGRHWVSPAGVNLYFTVLFSPPLSPNEASIITLAAPVSVAAAVRKHTGLPAEIKWPNDILIRGKKAGGILIEMKLNGNKQLLAVGIGLNVNMTIDTLPPEIRELSTSLSTEKGEPIDRLKLLRETLAELERCYKILLNRDKRALINEWLSLNCTIGKKVSVRGLNSIISGTADSINDKGELLVRLPSGHIETVRAGDVTILKDNNSSL